jgi:hypothetical protein
VASRVDDDLSGGTTEQRLQTVQDITANNPLVTDKIGMQAAGVLLSVDKHPDAK